MKVKLNSGFERVQPRRPSTRILVNYESVCPPSVALALSLPTVSRNTVGSYIVGYLLHVQVPTKKLFLGCVHSHPQPEGKSRNLGEADRDRPILDRKAAAYAMTLASPF